MKHTVQSLTPDVLVQIFGDSKDWCSVFKKGVRVGTFSELRGKVLKKQALADSAEKRKFHAALMKNDVIKETKEFFGKEFKNAEVFINRTQPNIHLNGHKCYIICGSGQAVRLGIHHAELTFDEMVQLSGREAKPNTNPNHALFSNLTLEDAKALINTLCGK